MVKSDLFIDNAKLNPAAITQQQTNVNDKLIAIAKGGPRWYEVGAAAYREMRRKGETPLPKPTYLDGIDFEIPSREESRKIPCRIMKPDKDVPVKGVFMHIQHTKQTGSLHDGGGWVLMTEKFQDPLLKTMANGGPFIVVSVGYRLAPEDPFPKGPEDCYDAAEWLVDHAEEEFGVPLKSISGESAGGHLSVLCALRLLKTRPNFDLAALVLHFGAYELAEFLPACRNFKKDLVLTYDIMVKYMEVFLPGLSMEKRRNPEISPLYADLYGLKLPPAIFTCGTEDCLLDDSVFMAAKWQMAGAETVLKLYPGAPHGFVAYPPDQVPAAKECIDHVFEFLGPKI